MKPSNYRVIRQKEKRYLEQSKRFGAYSRDKPVIQINQRRLFERSIGISVCGCNCRAFGIHITVPRAAAYRDARVPLYNLYIVLIQVRCIPSQFVGIYRTDNASLDFQNECKTWFPVQTIDCGFLLSTSYNIQRNFSLIVKKKILKMTNLIRNDKKKFRFINIIIVIIIFFSRT